MSGLTELSAKARAFSVEHLLSEVPKKRKNCEYQSALPAKVMKTESSLKDSIQVELVGRELWTEFHKLGTEMIITKAGRRMFPSLKIKVNGLHENLNYLIYVDIDPVGDRRYRYVYQSSKWTVAGPGDLPLPNRRYIHSDSPQTGRYWNSQTCIAFDKLKLTNSRKPQSSGLISLHSMHKYQPKIYIQCVSEPFVADEKWRDVLDCRNALCFVFEETQFVTVTAYQNQQITRLKIASNPFAKGFRDSCRENRTCDVTVQANVAAPAMSRRLILPARAAGIPVSVPASFWSNPCDLNVPLNYWMPAYPAFLTTSAALHFADFDANANNEDSSE